MFLIIAIVSIFEQSSCVLKIDGSSPGHHMLDKCMFLAGACVFWFDFDSLEYCGSYEM